MTKQICEHSGIEFESKNDKLKWIYIKEKIPYNEKKCLFVIDGEYKKILTGYFMGDGFFSKKYIFGIYLPFLKFNKQFTDREDIEFDIWIIDEYYLHNKITNWMPLPELSK